MKNVHLIFSYDGSNFMGYQIQNEERTVQYELMKAIEKINGVKIKLDASGRTDRGVHALEQHACFLTDRALTEFEWKKALNGLLPDDIYIKDVRFESEDFHPRFNVKSKTYLYKINTGEYNPFEKKYVYQLNKKLDIQKIIDASKLFIGKHDFRNFCSNEAIEDYSFEREIYDIKIEKSKEILVVFVNGSGFMRYMVRNIVGALIEIGLNKKDISIITNRLDKIDRDITPYCAPGNGLYLEKVEY